jgi:chromosome partitioning protein
MKIVALCSFKGGTAKTSSSIHIGAALAQFFKQRVLLVDFDAQANLTAGLGYDPDAQDSLAPVLQGNKRVEDVIISTCVQNLDLIPADTWLERVETTGVLASDRYSHEKLRDLLVSLPYDMVLIDTPPSLCWLTESALIASHFSLICLTPEFYSIKGLERLAEFTKAMSKRHPLELLGIVLSFWHPRGKSNATFLEVIEKTFPGKLLHTKVRRDIAISEASIYGKPSFVTAPRSRASEDYLKLTKELLGRIHQ